MFAFATLHRDYLLEEKRLAFSSTREGLFRIKSLIAFGVGVGANVLLRYAVSLLLHLVFKPVTFYFGIISYEKI